MRYLLLLPLLGALTGCVQPEEDHWVRLHTQLLITQGATSQISNLRVALRPVGSTRECSFYQLQAIENMPNGGVRSPAYYEIYAPEGKFELCWVASPTGASYGINMQKVRENGEPLPFVFFLNTATGAGSEYAQGVWHTIEVPE